MKYLNYISKVICRQCRFKARIKIPYMDKIEEVRCPKCGLMELRHPSFFGIKEDK